MEVWCNESIKRLITSEDSLLDDGSSAEERFNQAADIIEYQVAKDTCPTVVTDWFLRKQCEVTQTRDYYEGLIPLAFIAEAPPKYDQSLSRSVSIEVPNSKQPQLRKGTIERISQALDFSNYHNNLVESMLLGKAVYSWVKGKPTPYRVKRLTESHLPEGDYTIHLYFAKYEWCYANNSDPRGLGSNTYSPTYEVTYEPSSITDYYLVVNLQLVSKKVRNKGNKASKTNTNPEESVESLLEELDNIK